jgi:hypothetical protein
MFEALKYLYDVIRWKFSKKQFLGKTVYIKGKFRKVTGESYRFFIVAGVKRALEKQQYRPSKLKPFMLEILQNQI